jgi:peptidoglycan/xylan/chitin deacetylase (PgdA/CDA1 family)
MVRRDGEDEEIGRAGAADRELGLGDRGVIDRRMALKLGLGAATAAFVAAVAESVTGGHGISSLGRLGKGPSHHHTSDGSGTSSETTIPRDTTSGSAPASSTTSTLAPPPTTTTTLAPPPPTTTAPPPTTTTVPPPPPAPADALRFFGPAQGNSVYLTIDDGWFPDNLILDIMRSEHLPVTTFLIKDAALEYRSFWADFVDAGGQIQNHTVSHPWLTRVSPAEAEAQWEGASVAFARWFGMRPTLGRPPYGAVDDAVWTTAQNVGLSSLVMWSAVDNGQGLQTWNKGPLAPGSIVLFHWDPGLSAEFRQVLQAVDDAGLVPRYLPPSWPPGGAV